ncbi:ABC transporter permease [Streptomyces sp. YIM 98790]|uniref:ABC transporter permease n=1 Tax=Streptomyces sp. YIM 98790 TaxID=2689077 RepID=UPI00140AB885|nr:ABC transporter permease [Streptomyces sp. YIM 98790]
MTDTTAVQKAPSARGIVWARRRAALAGFWRLYRRQRAGLAGLALLLGITAATLLAPLYTDRDHLRASAAPGGRMEPPGGEFWFGTDQVGRPVLTLVVWGARVSLQVGITAAVLAVVLGTLVGMLAAHFGGWVSWLLMRLTDWFIVLPSLVLAIALVIALGPSKTTIIAAIALTSWAGTARLVRSQTMAIEGRPYLERARALGAGHWHQMTRHVLPHLMPLVLASATLQVSSAILAEASLSFLGLGDPSEFSWGTILERAFDAGAVSAGAWWYMLPPGLAILLVVLAFTLCGRAIEAVLNPRLRGST